MSSISLQHYISSLPDQQNIDCCTASSTLLAAEILMAKHGKRIRFSRLYLYYMTRKLQDRVGLRGASLNETFKALSIYGVATEAIWPMTINRVNKEPHAQAMEEAAYYKLQSYEQITTDQYKNFLDNGIPIVVGMFTGSKFWKLSGSISEHRYVPINDTDNRIYKGHAVVCIGYDDAINNGSWIIANSTGLRWGDRGYAAIPYECNSNLAESYVITDFAGITADKKIS